MSPSTKPIGAGAIETSNAQFEAALSADDEALAVELARRGCAKRDGLARYYGDYTEHERQLQFNTHNSGINMKSHFLFFCQAVRSPGYCAFSSWGR